MNVERWQVHKGEIERRNRGEENCKKIKDVNLDEMRS